jgi:hypothetical protein
MTHRSGVVHKPATPQENAAFLAILGAIFVAAAVYKISRGFGTSRWSPTQGRVSDAFVSEDDVAEDDRGSLRHGQRKMFALPRVLYTYSVGGRQFEGDCLRQGQFRIPIRFLVKRQVAAYRPGQRVTVYVSPRDPSKAVLKRGPPIHAFVVLAFGLALWFFAYAIY